MQMQTSARPPLRLSPLPRPGQPRERRRHRPTDTSSALISAFDHAVRRGGERGVGRRGLVLRHAGARSSGRQQSRQQRQMSEVRDAIDVLSFYADKYHAEVHALADEV